MQIKDNIKHYIIDNIDKCSNKELAANLNIPTYMVSVYIKEFGIIRTKKISIWSEEDIVYLKKYSKTLSNKELATILNKNPDSVRVKKCELKLRSDNYKEWSNDDLNTLITKYGVDDLDQISNDLKRANNLVYNKAIKLKLDKKFKSEHYTLYQLENKVKVSSSQIIKHWVPKGLKYKDIQLTPKEKKAYVEHENLKDFMEKNPDLWDSTNISGEIFSNKPKWLLEKQKEDLIITSYCERYLTQEAIDYIQNTNDKDYTKVALKFNIPYLVVKLYFAKIKIGKSKKLIKK